MRRISTPTAAQDLFGPGKHGFRNGDPANAILATRLEAAFFNALQEEVAGLVEQAGIALDPEDNTQLLKAVRKLRGGAVNFGFWQWSAVGANPAAGRVTLNNADPALASSLLIAESSAESLDYSPSLGMLRSGDTLSLQERDAVTVSHRFRVTGPTVDHGSYRSIPVSYVVGSGVTPAVDAMLSVLFSMAVAYDDTALAGRVTSLEARQRSLGDGQSWVDVLASRALATTYTNTTGRSIALAVGCAGGTTTHVGVTVNGVQVIYGGYNSTNLAAPSTSLIIPPGATYSVQASTALVKWMELR